MTIDVVRSLLLWCMIINFGLFFLSFLSFTLFHDFIYRIHGKWYNISEDRFNAIIYSVMVFYKILILFFNAVPYFALLIVG